MNDLPKSANPLLVEFPENAKAGMNLTSFDWEKNGVHLPYVVFITGRCGSTLLSNMIKDTKLAGTPDEYFNEGFIAAFNKNIKAETFQTYFLRLVKTYSSNWRFGFEIDWWRLRYLETIIDFTNVFSRNRTSFFYMTRRDILGQAWSFATAKATGTWHQFAEAPEDAQASQRPVLSDESIWREILLLLEAELQMENFFRRYEISPIRFDYEMLISNKRGALGKFLLETGCSNESVAVAVGGIVDRTNKMPSDNLAEMLSFRASYGGVLSLVESVRGVNYDVVKLRLREKYDLPF